MYYYYFTNTPHFKAYKCLVESARASECVSSTRECRVLSLSDIPEAATHEGFTTPGTVATLSHSPGIVHPSRWGSARVVPPAVLSDLGTKAGSASSGRWVSLKLAPPWSCITPVTVSWSEEMHTVWQLAITMSARPLPAGSETGRRTAGSAHSRSWRTDPPPLSWSSSKSSEPDSWCNLPSPWGIPFLESMSARGSGDRGCVLLWWRGSGNPPIAGDSLPACTELWSVRCLDDLCMRPMCYRCESVHAAVQAAAENHLEPRRLLPAPSGLYGTDSEVLTTAPKPACLRKLLPSCESMRPSCLQCTTLPSPGELPGWRDLGCATASELRCSRWRPRCSNGPKSTLSKGPLYNSTIAAAGACVVSPDDIPLKQTP